MPGDPLTSSEKELSSEEIDQEVSQVARNLSSVCEQLASLSTPSTVHVGDILEKSVVALEEVRNLNQLIGCETEAVVSTVDSVDQQLQNLDSLWLEIDKTVAFVAAKKQQLDQLEHLCTDIEKSIHK